VCCDVLPSKVLFCGGKWHCGLPAVLLVGSNGHLTEPTCLATSWNAAFRGCACFLFCANSHPFPVCCGCGFFMSGRKVHTETLQCPCQVDSGPSFQGPVQAWLVFNSAVSWCVAIAFKARSCFARLVGGSCQATTLGLWGEALDGLCLIMGSPRVWAMQIPFFGCTLDGGNSFFVPWQEEV